MNPEFQKLRREVNELLKWKQARERQQLVAPLDIQSSLVLNNAFRSVYFDRINVTDIFFQATQESPTQGGQMRYFNDRATQTFRGTTTPGVFTGSFDLTAV